MLVNFGFLVSSLRLRNLNFSADCPRWLSWHLSGFGAFSLSDHASLASNISTRRAARSITDFQPPLCRYTEVEALPELQLTYLPGFFVKLVVRFVRSFVKVYRKSAQTFLEKLPQLCSSTGRSSSKNQHFCDFRRYN